MCCDATLSGVLTFVYACMYVCMYVLGWWQWQRSACVRAGRRSGERDQVGLRADSQRAASSLRQRHLAGRPHPQHHYRHRLVVDIRLG